MTDWTAWGRQVAAAREKRGLSQMAAAGEAGMDRQTWSNYERGKVQRPSLETVRKICAVIALPIPHGLVEPEVPENEMPTVTRYFLAHPEKDRDDVRALLNRRLNASAGDVPERFIRMAVREIEDEIEERRSRQ